MEPKIFKKLQPYAGIIQLLEQQKGFSIIDLLGKGGFGTVFEIEDKKTKQKYALKHMSIYDGAGGEIKELLEFAQKEAEILKNNQHINIVQYIDSFKIGTNYFIQMEKCAFSLQDWVDTCGGTKIQRKIFLNYAHQILNGIQFLHSRNLVLRDISLKNTLLSIDDDDLENDGIIKLCDFGCAKEIDFELESHRFMSTNQYGVYHFLPPEVIEQMKKPKRKVFIQDFKGDIWAYGICLYILAGADPDHAIQLAKGKEVFQSQQCIDSDVNLFIKSILISNPNQRPNLEQISNQISILENDMNQPIFQSIKQPSNQFKTKTSQEYYEEGIKFMLKGEYDLAIEQLNSCLKINPKHQNGNLKVGQIYQKTNKLDESLQYLNKALEINPENSEIYCDIGQIYKNKGNQDLSLQYFQKSLEINPKCVFTNCCIGYSYFCKGYYDLSLQYFKKSLEINPEDYETNIGIGWVYYKKQNYDLTLQYFKKSFQINPKSSEADNGMHFFSYKNNNYIFGLYFSKNELEQIPNINQKLKNKMQWLIVRKISNKNINQQKEQNKIE